MRNRRVWFFAVLAAQAVFLLSWAGYHEWVRSNAPVIRLKVLPVDPRDIVRGQYFVMRYEISRVEVGADHGYEVGDEVWVGLDVEEEFARATGVYQDREEAESGGHAFLARGVVWNDRGFADWIGVRYGIEDFYVPEGTPEPDRSDLVVEASISATGNLYIRRVLLGGEPFP